MANHLCSRQNPPFVLQKAHYSHKDARHKAAASSVMSGLHCSIECYARIRPTFICFTCGNGRVSLRGGVTPISPIQEPRQIGICLFGRGDNAIKCYLYGGLR
ncbi:hypothetical protein CDAR_571761 [Caerostris darwini]|uniref:Uncharacterized protein n=1 Tax=Caerostris darwini TaxID=1538125 RepID=A0AAV4W5H2_9ARAC|nr:hypothetical protein CDAR_571761 [Caerostris darwini]